MSAVISVEKLSKWYGNVLGLSDITLEIETGITGILGPNGAGKSTFLKLITGQIKSNIGSVRLNGRPVWNNPPLYSRVGFCPEQDAFFEELSGRDCRFGYRTSIFNTTHRDRYIILKVAFSLRPYGKPRIQYEDLENYFSGRLKTPSIGEVRRAVIKIRESKGMILHQTDDDIKSAGSFFKNPVLEPDKATEIENSARDRGLLASTENLPRYSAPSGKVKLPAAWFVEQAGFEKGYTRGNVGISSKHALALVNKGDAQAREFIDLMHIIQDKVHSEFGIDLLPEPTLLGFEKNAE